MKINSDKLESLVVYSVSLVFIAVATFLYVRDILEKSNIKTEGLIVLGKISSVINDAKVRRSNSVVWERMSNGDYVYLNDAIRTASGSRAAVEFENGSSIDVEESSMIVINLRKKKYSIDFIKGDLLSRSKSSQIEINIEGKTLSLNSAEASINRGSDNKTTISVLRGQADVEGRGIGALERASLDSSGAVGDVSKIKIALQDPINGDSRYFEKKTGLVEFKWKINEKFSRTYLELARDVKFKSIVKSVLSKEESKKLRLQLGNYFWRVKGIKGGKNSFSQIRFLSVKEIVPFRLIFPLDKYVYDFVEKVPKVRFKWKSPRYVEVNYLEISKSNNFSTILKSIDLGLGNEYISTDLFEGSIYWRVKGVTNLQQFYSETREFKVVKRSKFPSPELRLPGNNIIKFADSLKKLKQPFSWEPVAEVKKYFFEISGDRAFTSVVFNQMVQNTSLIWVPASYNIDYSKFKNLYWRVRSVNFNNSLSEEKEIRTVILSSGNEIQIIKPEDNKTFEFEKIDTPINMMWEKESFKGTYLLKVSKNDLFTDLVLTKKINKNSYIFRTPKVGKYFWYLELHTGNGKLIKKSLISSFSVLKKHPPLPAPKIIFPGVNHVVKLRDEKDLVVEIKWKPLREATSYIIEVDGKTSSGDDYKKNVTSVKTTERVVFPSIGSYKFVVKALRENVSGINSEERSIVIINTDYLPPPKILEPIFE